MPKIVQFFPFPDLYFGSGFLTVSSKVLLSVHMFCNLQLFLLFVVQDTCVAVGNVLNVYLAVSDSKNFFSGGMDIVNIAHCSNKYPIKFILGSASYAPIN